ncbi:unnamed protein product [Dibothriocephalus latus]|uniref:Uncharacterized protein n=1 Tax=Dibothriocephalus latus TaxID=60516 RepID=A0A3P7LDR6_DIBLA|nr:unnamed protein product [Dibothriocephalus latus]
MLENVKVIQEERDQALAKLSALLDDNGASKTSPVLNQNVEDATYNATPEKPNHKPASTESWRMRNLSRALRARTAELRREQATSGELRERLRFQEERHKRAMWKLRRLEERSRKLVSQHSCRQDNSQLLVHNEAAHLQCKNLAKELRALATSKEKSAQLAGRLAKTYESLVVKSRASHRQAQRKDAVISVSSDTI